MLHRININIYGNMKLFIRINSSLKYIPSSTKREYDTKLMSNLYAQKYNSIVLSKHRPEHLK